jgi:RNA-binding protein
MQILTPAERRALRARAHPLHPVVIVGQQGLTPAVLHEIDIALTAHELIKIRVFSNLRADRDALLVRICAEMDAAPVQHLGKVLTVWRPKPAPEVVAREARPARRPRDAAASVADPAARRTATRKPSGSGVTEAPAGRRDRSTKPRAKNTPARRRPSDVTDTGATGKRRAVKGAMAPEDRRRAPATAKGPFEPGKRSPRTASGAGDRGDEHKRRRAIPSSFGAAPGEGSPRRRAAAGAKAFPGEGSARRRSATGPKAPASEASARRRPATGTRSPAAHAGPPTRRRRRQP